MEHAGPDATSPVTDAPLGAARLMKLAFDGVDLLPLRLELMDRYIFASGDVAALMDLAVVEQIFGNRAIGLDCQAEALKTCRLFRSPASAAAPRLRVLAFVAAGDIGANIPLEFLIEGSDIELHTLYIVPGLKLPAALPPHDVAIVAIGEADAHRAALSEVAAVAATWSCPVLNAPNRVAHLARERLGPLLRGVPGLTLPATVRLARAELAAIGEGRRPVGELLPEGDFPLIVRPLDSHAGRGLARLAGPHEIAPYLEARGEGHFHLAPFIDYRSADGLFRKYRIAFVDGMPYPGHMAISDAWKIWYANARMDESAPKRAEEARFMTGFARDFGLRHRAALAALAERVGLEYFGIDCAETPDGELLVFEADIAQVVHDMDPPSLFPYKGPQMQRLFAAFRAMLLRYGTGDRGGGSAHLYGGERAQTRHDLAREEV
jgi:glutathione synthase/RimK-type ligase-like ATP-grasp enzyme